MNRRLALVPALLLVAVVVLMASPGTGLLPYFSPARSQAPGPARPGDVLFEQANVSLPHPGEMSGPLWKNCTSSMPQSA